MCGRFALYEPTWAEAWERLNGGTEAPVKPTKPDEGEFRPSYNIAPMQMTAAVLCKDDEIKGAMCLWSLVPPWLKDPLEKKRSSTLNARVEGVLSSKLWGPAMKRHRCLVPANHFYEWRKDGPKDKTAFTISMRDESLMTFAGIWTYWRGTWKDEPWEGYTFAILTTGPNSLMERIHDRMPVIVAPEDRETWLKAPAEDAVKLASDPLPSQLMRAWPVGREIGNVRNQGAGLAEPIDKDLEQ